MSQHEVTTILVVLALAPAGAFYLWARSYYQARSIPTVCSHETDGYSEWDLVQEDLWRCNKCGTVREHMEGSTQMAQVAVNYKNSGRAIEREALALKLSMAFDELDAQYEVKTTEDDKGWHFDILLYDFGEIKGRGGSV